MSLEYNLTAEKLEDLRNKFLRTVDKHNYDDLSLEEFKRSIKEIMETGTYEKEAHVMFLKITEKSKEKVDLITWNAFLDYLIENLKNSQEKKFTSSTCLDLGYNFKLLTHNRRALTARIVSVAESSFVYVFISKLGVVGILDSSLRLQKTYVVDVDDIQRDFTKNGKRVCQAWVTDALHMPDSKKLVIGTTNRTIHFFDISAANHFEEFRMFGLPNIVTCFAYWCDEENEENGSMLFYGDDIGNVHYFHFLQPQTLLFRKDGVDVFPRVYFMDLEYHREYVTYRMLDKVHQEAVVSIQYNPKNACIISCSEDLETPLVIRDIHDNLKSYVFKLTKGIQCFDFHPTLNLLVTGSRDSFVRFWNPYVPAQATAILKGHQVTVIDVKIMSERHLVVSYSRDMVLRLWDICEHTCLQIIHIKFPIVSSPAVEPDNDCTALHIDTSEKKSILVACRDYVTELKLVEDEEDQLPIEIPEGVLLFTTTAADGQRGSIAKFSIGAKSMSDSMDTINQQQQQLPNLAMQALTSSGHSKMPTLCEANPSREPNEADALAEFGTYIFTKLRHFDGHLDCREMKEAVGQGLSFQALKLHDPEEVRIESNLPMSDRMRTRGVVYHSDADLLALNLSFMVSSIPDGRASRRSSMGSVRSHHSMSRVVAGHRAGERLLQLPPLGSAQPSRSQSRSSSVCSNANNHNGFLTPKPFRGMKR